MNVVKGQINGNGRMDPYSYCQPGNRIETGAEEVNLCIPPIMNQHRTKNPA